MNLFEARNLALSKMYVHGLIDKGWKFDFHTRKRAYGTCNYTDKTIYLSAALLPLMTDKAVLDTILHEIAHALCPGQKHNAVWRRMCIKIGGDGLRCGTLETKGKEGAVNAAARLFKWTLTCPVCNNKTHLARKPKYGSSCAKCNPHKFDARFRNILKMNY